MIPTRPMFLFKKRLRRLQLAILFLALCSGGFAQGHDPDAMPESPPAEALSQQPQNEAPLSSENPSLNPDTTKNEAKSGTAVLADDTSPTDEDAKKVYPDTIVSAGILVDGLQYDIPMPWGHDEFEALRAFYLSSGGKKWLKTVMERSLPYLSYIEEKVEELGLPKELVFLPVIESEYSPFAVSRSGATGLWQFMRNSISGYGMSISDWIDDRKDFMKSTDAALQKLQDNYEVLGDWLLAIAAYNAGLGAVSRAVKSANGESIDFWHLYESKKLSREPLSYVPKFLAVASILRYPDIHGLPSEEGEKHDWEALETCRQVDLSVLSARAGIPLDILKLGNAELKYSITPPVASHMVKVPADKVDEVKTILQDTSSPLFRYEIYKVKSGDTISAIAQRFGTPMGMIIQTNPGLKADKIKTGQTIMIPYIPGSSKTKNASATNDDLVFSDYYTVKKGDTLWDISLLFDLQPKVLAEKNGLSMNSVLKIGQRLKVPPR